MTLFNTILNSLCSSPSDLIDINFFVPDNKKLNTTDTQKYFVDINRLNTIESIDKFLNDFKISTLIEAGMYEYTIVYVYDNNFSKNLIEATYVNKHNDIVRWLDPQSSEYSSRCVENLKNGNIDPQELSFLSSHEINPKEWQKILDREQLKEFRKNNMATTTLYKCYKCGENKCRVTEMQTRSGDEPMTTFITCMVCNNTFKR